MLFGFAFRYRSRCTHLFEAESHSSFLSVNSGFLGCRVTKVPCLLLMGLERQTAASLETTLSDAW